MTIPESADYFKTTERTISDWRKRGAPVDNVAALTTWLEENLRHTTLDTQAVIDRRRKIENAGRVFLRGYTELCESLPFPRCSDWEVVIVASLHQINHEMENLALTFVPEAAIKPEDKEIFERIQAEPWPLTGSAENLELEPPQKRKE